NALRNATSSGCLEHGTQTIGRCFVRTEESEILRIKTNDVAQEFTQADRSLGGDLSRTWNVEGIVRNIRQLQIHQQPPPINVGIGAYTAVALRRQFRQIRNQ